MSSELVRALQTQLIALGLPEPEYEYRFCDRRWRFDLAWPAAMLAVEADGGTWLDGGGRHNRAAGYEADCDKLNTATLLGWRILRVTGAQINDGRAIGYIEAALKVGVKA